MEVDNDEEAAPEEDDDVEDVEDLESTLTLSMPCEA